MKKVFLGIAVGCALLGMSTVTPGCGGGSCAQPNPNYDPSDPGSQACLDAPGAVSTGTPSEAFTVTGASFTLTDPPTDDSVQITPVAGSSGQTASATNGESESSAAGNVSGAPPMQVNPGDSVKVSVSFSAPNGNVTGVGVRFGNGPIQVVQVPGAEGQTSGQMDVDVEVPDSVCNNLSQICHDIKCYEFAVTDAGEVSAANINSIALKCGNCDEPSCQSLLDNCEEEEACGECPADTVCVDDECQIADMAYWTELCESYIAAHKITQQEEYIEVHNEDPVVVECLSNCNEEFYACLRADTCFNKGLCEAEREPCGDPCTGAGDFYQP